MVFLRGLRGHYRETLTSASYLVLLLFGLQFAEKTAWLICLSGVAVISLFAWTSTHRRARAIFELATSRIGSAAQGYVELQGRASADPRQLITSPISGRLCLWYRYAIYSKDNKNGQWQEVARATSDAIFEIKDSTGSCQVDPDEAEVMSSERRVTHQGGEKKVEELLLGGGLIYVLGEFSTLGGVHSVLDLREDVGTLLTEWKKDAVGLKRRFDLNGDGVVDLQEWELARRLASRTVEKQHREIRAESGVHVIHAPKNGRLFLISSWSPHKLRLRYRLWSFFHLSIFALATFAVVWLGSGLVHH